MADNVKYLSSNIFNLEIFTKKEVVIMIENLVKTIDLLMPATEPDASDEHVAEMLNSFGLTDSTRDLKQLKSLTGKTLYDHLLESMKKVSKEDVFANRYLRKYSKEYREIESSLPVMTSEQRNIINQIAVIQVGFMEDFAEKYPKLAKNARSITSADDSAENTSYETYLKGELSTYSPETLTLYGRFIADLYSSGKNPAELIMLNTVKLYGYKNLDDAESKL